jgi:hypothetical protein
MGDSGSCSMVVIARLFVRSFRVERKTSCPYRFATGPEFVASRQNRSMRLSSGEKQIRSEDNCCCVSGTV